MRRIHVLVAALAALAVGGCGQKGPLVLPDAQRPHKKVTMPHSNGTATGSAPAATPPAKPTDDATATGSASASPATPGSPAPTSPDVPAPSP